MRKETSNRFTITCIFGWPNTGDDDDDDDGILTVVVVIIIVHIACYRQVQFKPLRTVSFSALSPDRHGRFPLLFVQRRRPIANHKNTNPNINDTPHVSLQKREFKVIYLFDSTI